MRLNELETKRGSRQSRCRVGRGLGSGTGKTSRRGQKGQKSRSGAKIITGFEGGQMPLYRRLPKRGFKSRSASTKSEVSLASVLRALETGKLQADQEINLVALRKAGLIRKSKALVKIIGRTEVPMALTVNVSAATQGARQSIQENGGTCVTSSLVSQSDD